MGELTGQERVPGSQRWRENAGRVVVVVVFLAAVAAIAWSIATLTGAGGEGDDRDAITLLVVGAVALLGLAALLILRRPGGEVESAGHHRWSALLALIVSAVVTVVLLGAIVGMLSLLAQEGGSGPVSALSLVFVAAAVVLVLVMGALAIVFRRLGIANRSEAMGLPAGSVRAVIALMFVLLFFIAAIFLFNSTRDVADPDAPTRTLEGISEERLALIETDQISSLDRNEVGETVTYDVTLLPPSASTGTSDDIAKQLVTTLATLVTAVAAFYFGANTVTSATKQARNQEPLLPVPFGPDGTGGGGGGGGTGDEDLGEFVDDEEGVAPQDEPAAAPGGPVVAPGEPAGETGEPGGEETPSWVRVDDLDDEEDDDLADDGSFADESVFDEEPLTEEPTVGTPAEDETAVGGEDVAATPAEPGVQEPAGGAVTESSGPGPSLEERAEAAGVEGLGEDVEHVEPAPSAGGDAAEAAGGAAGTKKKGTSGKPTEPDEGRDYG